ncbi:MAG: DNA helicase RecQ [Calditrichaeota bacterium]|nr:MAG: DNA helicase RecQ [Calditrichota bacterium]
MEKLCNQRNVSPEQVLKSVFGYDEFRPLQREIIDNVLSKRDTLVIMPTGGGKSLCYQLPALLFSGMTVVVSPLISLMKDQVEQLQQSGVTAVFLNSSLDIREYQAAADRVLKGEIRLLYVAPEGLLTERMLNLLSGLTVDCLTIDEAHCISEWGHDFRPEYRQLVQVRDRFPQAVCIALTATATKRVQQDIMETLQFAQNDCFIAGFNRENLFLQVIEKTDPKRQLLAFLEQHPNQSGIIYCFSRKQVESLSEFLVSHHFSVLPYHAGLEDAERKRNQEAFIRDDVQIMTATIAFGMGINKPNVRFVVHYDLPKNIESYYQEIGRAGRDGLRADCLLLFSYGDLQKIRFLIDQKEDMQERLTAQIHLEALVRYAESEQCRRRPLLTYFGDMVEQQTCGMCDNCVEEKEEKSDITVAAQKFLSCVKRTGELFGANHIIDVLRGSESQKVIDFRHHQLSTYGIGKEFSKEQWQRLARQFLLQDLLVKDMQHGSLKITAKGAAVLFQNQPVFGRLQEQAITVAGVQTSIDQELFERLRQKRKVLAAAQNVPPYVIFSDRSLTEMATIYPVDQEMMLTVNGVGAVKLAHYGEEFLEIIRAYCAEKGITPERISKPAPMKSMTSQRRFMQVGEAFCSGVGIDQLMAQFSIKRTTFIGYLQEYHNAGNFLPAEYLLASSQLSPDLQQEVLEAFARLGSDYLKPVFEALGGKVGYEELRLIRMAEKGKKD